MWGTARESREKKKLQSKAETSKQQTHNTGAVDTATVNERNRSSGWNPEQAGGQITCSGERRGNRVPGKGQPEKFGC